LWESVPYFVNIVNYVPYSLIFNTRMGWKRQPECWPGFRVQGFRGSRLGEARGLGSGESAIKTADKPEKRRNGETETREDGWGEAENQGIGEKKWGKGKLIGESSRQNQSSEEKKEGGRGEKGKEAQSSKLIAQSKRRDRGKRKKRRIGETVKGGRES
jgi:hypothetical protein